MSSLWHDLHTLLEGLLHWVESFADSPRAGLWLFGISFAESSFFPVPPDVLLIALCLAQPDRSFIWAAICAAASVLGGIAGYGIGYFGGRPVLLRLFSREKVAVVERMYEKYNAWATGIAGLTPIPYKIFTIAGGAFAINLGIFCLASLVSRSVRFFAVAALIYFFGEPIRTFVESYLNILSIGFVILVVVGFLLVGRGAKKASTVEPGQ